MDTHILHLDLDTFFVSVERLLQPALKGLPVIIGGEVTSSRGVVSACSYEARAFGVHSAMPIVMARRLCPQGIYLRGSHDKYGYYSELVTEVIADHSPLFEKASVDEFYIDLTGMDRFHGCFRWSHELRQRIIKESGLPVSFGLSGNKTVAKIATDACKPDGELHVPAAEARAFLSPRPVEHLPGVGPETRRTLNDLGIYSIGQLQNIPLQHLLRGFGATGRALWQKSQGLDNSPVVPYREEKSISHETTFGEDSIDQVMLESTLANMAAQLAFELRRMRKLTACVTVKLRYSDFDTHTRQQHIPYSANEQELTVYVRNLFRALFSRRVRVRLVGVRFSRLVSGNPQAALFTDTHESVHLMQAMDAVRTRFGKAAICWGNAFVNREAKKDISEIVG